MVIVTAWQVGAVGTELGKYLAPSTGPFEKMTFDGAVASRLIVTVCSARRVCIHLPEHWPCEHAWNALHTAACGPPGPATS